MADVIKIAVISDTHLGVPSECVARRCDIADVLLKRAVFRLNRLIRPDVTVVLGDIIDNGDAARADGDLKVMRGILDTLDSPYIAIPGNHDGDVERFYRVFERPAHIVDIAGIRFLPFVDKEEPRCWASRSEVDISRMREARAGYSGPIVSLQHVCLHTPKEGRVPPYYNYTNAGEIIRVMKEAGVFLSISGHHHAGADDSRDDNVMFVNAPGLCESPFPFVVITLEDGKARTERHSLCMPKELGLVDSHVHTQLAYCSENMDVERAIRLAKDFGMAGITFTEHSGQLYFDRKPYWRNAWLMDGMAAAEEGYNRMGRYLALKALFESDFAQFSLETECDASGRLLLKSQDASKFKWLMGTVHAVPGLGQDAAPAQRECDQFLYLVESLCRNGVKVLAHPLRVFARLGWPAPEVLFDATARLLAEYGVAAELNFHSNNVPPLDFVRVCLKHGVKFSFGSDAHNLAEIGDFACQIAHLEAAGFVGSLSEVLWTPQL